MKKQHETSYTLLSRALDLNDQDAWGTLLDRYKKFIYHILQQLNVSPNEIDDLSQQCLLNLRNKIQLYDRTKGKFRAWLATTITNTVKMYFRKENTLKKYESQFAADNSYTNSENSIETFINQEWEQFVVGLAIETVRKNFKGKAIEVFNLDMEDKTTKEIAKLTQLSEASVYVLRNRVKQNLMLEIKSLVKDMEF